MGVVLTADRYADFGAAEMPGRETPLASAGNSISSAAGTAGSAQQEGLPPSKPGSLNQGPASVAISPRSSRGLPDIGSPVPSSPVGPKANTPGTERPESSSSHKLPG